MNKTAILNMSIKTAELGCHFSEELKQQCRAIYGGVAWPGENPGCVVVVAMSNDKHFDSYDLCLLNEFESFDVRELVRQCWALDYKYHPKRWMGDKKNDAADKFIDEINSENPPSEDDERELFYIYNPPILEMEHPYPYMLGRLKELLNKDRKQLWLKEGKVSGHVLVAGRALDEGCEEDRTFKIGKYPAVEALAFAVIEMREYESKNEKPRRRFWRENRRSPMRF